MFATYSYASTPYAATPSGGMPPPSFDLGRFRHGDEVRKLLSLGEPSSVPVASIYRSGAFVKSVPVPPTPPSGKTFKFSVTPCITRFPVGSYVVYVLFVSGGVTTAVAFSFDVIPGGDSAGAVNTLAVIDRPEGSYLLAQVASGRLLQGNNPRVPTT